MWSFREVHSDKMFSVIICTLAVAKNRAVLKGARKYRNVVIVPGNNNKRGSNGGGKEEPLRKSRKKNVPDMRMDMQNEKKYSTITKHTKSI